MSSVRWSTPSRRDVTEIATYLKKRDGEAAATVVRTIRDSASILMRHPFAGEPLGDSVLRKLSVGAYPYVLIYRTQGAVVEILRVHHTAQNWKFR